MKIETLIRRYQEEDNPLQHIKAHLKRLGFDGVVCPDAECGCSLDELPACDGLCDESWGAKRYSCDSCEDYEDCSFRKNHLFVDGCYRRPA